MRICLTVRSSESAGRYPGTIWVLNGSVGLAMMGAGNRARGCSSSVSACSWYLWNGGGYIEQSVRSREKNIASGDLNSG
jgi:hypothetical protein